jgi:oxygen-dependent protoporphyrinogen oxidase
MIGIVGGGISGLVLALELRRLGVEVTVWEAASVPGGVMRSEIHRDLVLEMGPQRARLSGPFRQLVESVGLTEDLITAPTDLPLYVYHRGRLRRAPLSFWQAVTTDLLPWWTKARVLAEPFTTGPGADERVGPFLRRKFGGAAYQALLGPLYGGLYASDPDRMPVKHALQRTLVELGVQRSILWRILRSAGQAAESPPCSFREGLGSLPIAITGTLGGSVRLNAPVRTLRRMPDGWEVAVDGADPVRAEAVVLACPSAVAARLLGDAYPDEAARLSALWYNRLALVYLKSEARLRGLGYQVAFGESLETRGVTWNDSLFGRSGLYTAYLGGMKNPELPGWDDDRIAEIASREFEVATGHRAEAVHVSRTSIPAWDETWDGLVGTEWPPDLRICSNYTARPGILGRITEANRLAVTLAKEYPPGSITPQR